MNKLKNKKSQAALEFLMSYSWALAIILISMGALYYFGIFSETDLVRNVCITEPGISCLDHTVEKANNRITLSLKNNNGYDISGVQISSTGCDNLVSADLVHDGELKKYTLNNCDFENDNYRGNLEIFFVRDDTGLDHSITGSIIASSK